MRFVGENGRGDPQLESAPGLRRDAHPGARPNLWGQPITWNGSIAANFGLGFKQAVSFNTCHKLFFYLDAAGDIDQRAFCQ
jgi:hypothetical protein